MKKITSFLMMFMLFVGMGWAQKRTVVTGYTNQPGTAIDPANLKTGYYFIRAKGYNENKFAWLTAEGRTVGSNIIGLPNGLTTDDRSVWYIEGNIDGFSIALGYDKSCYWDTPGQFTKKLVTRKPTLKGTKTTQGEEIKMVISASWNGGTSWYHYNNNDWYLGSWNTEQGNQMCFEFFEANVTTNTEVPVTYQFKINNEVVETVKVGQVVGTDYVVPDVAENIQKTFTPGTVLDLESQTVEVTVTEDLPFKKSTDFAHATWYYMTLHPNKYYLNYEADATSMALTRNTTSQVPEDKDLWCFVGNSITGFKVYNRAAGNAMVLSSSITMSDNQGETTYPILTASNSLQEKNETWQFVKRSNFANSNIAQEERNGAFFMYQTGFRSNKVNLRNNKLSFWTGGADDGSTLLFKEAKIVDDLEPAMQALLAEAEPLLAFEGKVGYPSDFNVFKTAVSNAKQSTSKENYHALQAALTNLYNSTTVNMPVAGKAYTFRSVNNVNSNVYYLKSNGNNGASFAVGAENAEVFVCRNVGGKYLFVNQSGRYLVCVNKNNNGNVYPENYSALTCDIAIAPLKKGANNNVENTESAQKKLFGTFYLTTEDRINDSNNGACLILTKDGAVDVSNSPYFNGNHSSAIIMEEATAFDLTNVWAKFKAPELAMMESTPQTVGYPNSTARQTLQNALDGATVGDFAQLSNAYNAFVSTEQVNKPENGKAYYISLAHQVGARYLALNTKANSTNIDVKQNTEDAAKFICRVLDNGKYVFVTEDGRYFFWATDTEPGSMNLSGTANGIYTANYTAGHDWTLVPGAKVKNKSAKMGTFGLKALPKKTNEGEKYLMMQADGDFHNTNDTGLDHDDKPGEQGNCIYWRFEETTYANNPTLTILGNSPLVKIDGAARISTFSAPFATVIPTEVSAYYIAKNGMKKGYASLTKIGDGIVPANTGVILTGTDLAGENALMVPSTETGTVLGEGENLLQHTAGAAQSFDANSIFILAKNVNKGIGFYYGKAGSLAMNKAYVNKNDVVTSASVNGLKLVYGDEVTGIEGVEVGETENAPIYDLSGRRVMNTVKGSFYIQNGKKFIVK